MNQNDNIKKVHSEYLRGMARWYLALNQSPNILKDQYFCLDSDVVTMFHSPEKSSGYIQLRYQVAADQNDSHGSVAATALSLELSRFILYELSGNKVSKNDSRPILSGVSKEIRSSLNRLYTNFERNSDHFDTELEQLKLAAEAANHASVRGSEEDLNKALKGFATKWLDSDYFKTTDSLNRLTDLLVDKTNTGESKNLNIAHVDRCKFKLAPDEAETFLPIIYDGGELRDKFLDNYKTFCTHLNVSGDIANQILSNIEESTFLSAKITREYKKATDAYDLAFLKTINESIGDMPNTEVQEDTRHFLCLISGSHLMAKSVAELMGEAKAKRYIIDPLNLLSALIHQINGAGEDEAPLDITHLKDMLRGVLLPAYRETRFSQKGQAKYDFKTWLQKLADGSLTLHLKTIDVNQLNEVLIAWENLCLAVAARSNCPKWTLTDKLKAALENPDGFKVEAWLNNIRNLFVSTKVDLAAKLALLQPGVEFNGKKNVVFRHISPMRLEQYPITRDIADRMLKEDLTRAQIDGEISKVNKEESSGYLALLLRGLIESRYYNFDFSKIIFWAAYETADKLYNNSHEHITGRDAAYALAVNLRLGATKATFKQDMRRSTKYLNIAIDRQEQVHKKSDIRFELEQQAYKLTVCWASRIPLLINEEAIKNDRLRDIFNTCNQILQKVSDEENDTIQKYVTQHLCMIAIQAWLLLRYAISGDAIYIGLRNEVDNASLEKVIATFQDFDETPTPLMKVLRLICIKEGFIIADCVQQEVNDAIGYCKQGDMSRFELIDTVRGEFFKKILEYKIDNNLRL